MTAIGPLAFLEPWILAALAVLPLIWWLLRATPPAPRRQGFPAIRLLLGLKAEEETPARTPWWLVALRLFIAALIIVALARPILDPREELAGEGPLLVVIDDGWAAAARWDEHRASLDQYLAEAERKGESLRLLLTAPAADGSPPGVGEVTTATQARARLQGLEPKPWPVDRAAATEALAALDPGEAWRVLWMADGIEDADGTAAADFGAALAALGPVMRLLEPRGAKLLRPPENAAQGIVVTLERAEERGEDLGIVVALRDDGREVARLPVTFADGETGAGASLELPIELANVIGRLVLEGESTAGGVYLLDENSRRRPVGLLESGADAEAQPLFSELYYVERALAPFAEIQRGTLETLLAQPLAVLVLPDESVLGAEERDRITAFLDEGGLVLRFAGPKLAANPDDLLPVQLRGGGRTMGGIMTWDQPAAIAPFVPPSPYAGLQIPADVVVNQQVLAEPSLDLAEKTWAKLSDGTPLVTAEPRGEGLLVLFHTTANNAWSNLAFSGLFVEMLVRTVEAARGVAGLGEGEALPPLNVLDGLGRLVDPSPTVLSLGADTLEAGDVGPTHPPGYYGSDAGRRAFNLETAVEALTPLPQVAGIADRGYARAAEVELKAPLLAGALVLALVDLLVSLFLRGLLPTRLAGRSAATLFFVALLAWPRHDAAAQDARDSFALLATLETRLAYVETGDDEVDEISRAGLNGLALALTRRTSVEPAEPLGVNLASDEIVFFPLLYWPVTATQDALDQATRDKVNRFLATGGSILFDLRDPAMTGFSDSSVDLQRLTDGLDIPPLEPVPPEHVLTKAFYLLQDFPGRYAGGELWVDAAGSTANDGVAAIIIGSNDWAAAWAIGDTGLPIYAVIPEGERQREMAYRFGINLVMYVLTGNYKADQVHVPFILERLGQ